MTIWSMTNRMTNVKFFFVEMNEIEEGKKGCLFEVHWSIDVIDLILGQQPNILFFFILCIRWFTASSPLHRMLL